jgi:septal ring factor EnvC (AmiA/AmiB activator)
VGNGELKIENGELPSRKPKQQDDSAGLSNTGIHDQRANSQFSILNSQLAPACSAAADELTASRVLIDALERDNAALKQRLEIEKQTTQLLTELNQTRKSESEALRSALAAKNETLTAKDAVIASQDKLIETLKRKKSSPWKRVGDVLIGIGLGTLL